MVDAPERIWAWRHTGRESRGEWLRAPVAHADAEYIRRDIADRENAELRAEVEWRDKRISVLEALNVDIVSANSTIATERNDAEALAEDLSRQLAERDASPSRSRPGRR